MSYIDRNLLPDERILFRTKKSLIIFFYPVLLLIFSVYATSYMATNQVLQVVQWAPWVVVGAIWSFTALNYLSSEFAVTNKRIMMREGFFTRHANELRLTAVSQVNVEQNLIGQVLNFGTVSINAFGASDSYTIIAKPAQFQRSVNEQIDNALSGRK